MFNDGFIEINGRFTVVGDFINRATGSFTNRGITEVKRGSIKNEGVL